MVLVEVGRHYEYLVRKIRAQNDQIIQFIDKLSSVNTFFYNNYLARVLTFLQYENNYFPWTRQLWWAVHIRKIMVGIVPT